MLKRVDHGDGAAFRRELAALYPRLWRFCLMLAGARSHADDLAQATCERALSNMNRFTPGTRLDRWLFALARNIWLNELRAQKVREGGGMVALSEVDLPDQAPGAETSVFAAEVLAEIGRLPEHHRVTVLLVYVEGYSYKEAASFLGAPIGTVMSRLAAARKALTRVMAKEEGAA